MEYIRLLLLKNLLHLRKTNKLSQVDVAKGVGVSQASYARWESGQAWPDPDYIEKLAVFYSVRSSYFFHDPELQRPIDSIELPLDKKLLTKKLQDVIDLINK